MGVLRPTSSVRAVEPLPTDLAQRVGPPLRGRALVIVAVRPRLGVEDRAQGGEERFAGFGVEVAVDPDYPQLRRGGVQPPPRSRRIVAPKASVEVDLLAPEGDDALEVADRVHPGRLHELRPRPIECLRIGLARRGEHLDGRHRNLSFLQGSE